MLTKTEFYKKVNELKDPIPSVTGKAFYSGFRFEGNILSFHRVIPRTNWKLDVDVLFTIYITYDFINTSVVKRHTGGRVNSPSVAILMAIGSIDYAGNRK